MGRSAPAQGNRKLMEVAVPAADLPVEFARLLLSKDTCCYDVPFWFMNVTVGSYPIPVDCSWQLIASLYARWRTGDLFDGQSSFTNCTVLSITVLSGWQWHLRGGWKWPWSFVRRTTVIQVTARSRAPQLPPRFSEAFHTAKSFVYLPAPSWRWKAPTFPL